MQKNLLKSITLLFFLSLACQDVIGQGLRKVSQSELKEKSYESIQSALIRNDQTLGYIKFDKSVRGVDLNLQKLFKLDNAFSFEKSAVALSNVEAIRLQQKFNNIPIIGEQYIVRKSKNGEVLANGYYRKDVKQFSQKAPSVSEEQALRIALENISGEVYMWEHASNEKHIKQLKQNDKATYYPQAELVYTSVKYNRNEPIRLAYQFDIYVQSPLAKFLVEVDAVTGEILNKYNQLHTTDAVGTGLSLYNGVVDLNINSNAGTFELVDNTRGDGIVTYDMQNGIDYGTSDIVTSNDDFFNDETSRAGVSAHYGAAATYDYFINNFGLDSFDGLGSAINSYVRYEVGLVNAYWDGYRMTYGDGDGVNTTALTTLDIIGHEISHAVTQYSADLLYQDESGALNESFSDIFGQAIEFEVAPETASWNLGDEIFLNNTDMIRSFSNPNAEGQPDTYLGDYWYSGTGDNGGVHYNSGVQNFWFYLLVEGGSGTNDVGYSYNVPSIGLEKAQQIAFQNLQLHLTPNSNYMDARTGAEDSAEELFGANSPEYLAVVEAWNAVGVPTQEPVLSIPTTVDIGRLVVNDLRGFELIIRNQGLDQLIVDSLSFTDEAFSANMGETSFVVEGEDFYSLMTDFETDATGVYDAHLILYTNAGTDSIQLRANVVAEPSYTVSTDSISETLLVGNTKPISFQLTNNNDYDLSFLLEKREINQTAFNYVPTGEFQMEGKIEVPTYVKSQVQSMMSAVPLEGYNWRDTDDGVSFSWIEISDNGTAITLSDDSYVGNIDLGMIFPFYNNDYSTINICSNGWMSFTTGASSIWNTPLPSVNAPANVVALLAADLHPGSGQCYYKYDSDSRKFVVQYSNWRYYGGSGTPLTMQVQFSENGEIKLLYQEVLTDAMGTVGIQNDDQSIGLTVAQNAPAQIYSGYAVEIIPELSLDWLVLSSDTVNVAAGSTLNVPASINGTLLDPGVHSADINVSVLELQAEPSMINVEVEVLPGANLVVDSLVNLETIFVGDTSMRQLSVKNTGSVALNISEANFVSPSGLFTFDLQPQEIAPQSAVLVDLIYSSETVGVHTDTLNIVSNDAEFTDFRVVFNGRSVEPPVMSVSADLLEIGIISGDSTQESLTISNVDGQSDLYLNYSIGQYDTEGANWLSLNVEADTISAGETKELILDLNASNLYEGLYNVDLIVSGNDPLNNEVIVPITIDVTGVPELTIQIDSLVFEDRLLGETDSLDLTLTNTGTGLLSGEITIEGTSFTVTDNLFDIAVESSLTIRVAFVPLTAEMLNENLILTSNDAENPSQIVQLIGRGLAEPDLGFSVTDINFSGYAGDNESVQVTIENRNDYDLELALTKEFLENRPNTYVATDKTAKAGKVEVPVFELAKQQEAKTSSANLEYEWRDTNDGVTFNWIDISGSGTEVSLSDDRTVGNIDMGISFPFYEADYSTINICSNGWISFTNSSSSIWNQPLPSSDAPENVVALLAEDLHPGSGKCFYQYDQASGIFIVQYSDWRYYSGSGTPLTMQAQLYPSGKIKLLYQKVEDAGYGTVGIQNTNRTEGLTVAYNDPSRVVAGYAVEISRGEDWFEIDEDMLSIPAASSRTLTVSSNTEGLMAGEFNGLINTYLPQFDRDMSPINVSLNIDAASNMIIEEESIEFGQSIINTLTSRKIRIQNSGNANLVATLSTDSDVFDVDVTSIDIPAFSVDTITVSLLATEVNDYSGTLTISSNDPDLSELLISLSAEAKKNAQLTISASKIMQGIAIDATDFADLTLSNSDSSVNLNYTISVIEGSGSSFSNKANQSYPVGFYSTNAEKPSNQVSLNHMNSLLANSQMTNATDSLLERLENFPQTNVGGVVVNGMAYVVSYGQSMVYKYSLNSRQIVESYSIHANPYGIAYDGENFWIGAVQQGVVRGYNSDFELIGDFDLPTSNATYGLTFIDGTFKALEVLMGSNNTVYSLSHTGEVLATNTVEIYGDAMQLTTHNEQLFILLSLESGAVDVLQTELNTSTQAYEILATKSFTTPDQGCYTLFPANNRFVLGLWEEAYYVNGFGPNWITVNTLEGTLEEGQSDVIQIDFDSQGLEEGLYYAQLVINTNDPNNLQAQVEVVLSVGNFPPEVLQQIEAQILPINLETPFKMQLSDYFTDPDGDALFYGVAYSGGIVIADVIGDTLSIMSKELGTDMLTVTANDGNLLEFIEFTVEVTDGILGLKEVKNKLNLYPNPTLDRKFYVNSSSDMTFRVFDIKGAEVQTDSMKTAEGYQLHILNSEVGMYFVKGITSDGAVYSGVVVLQ